VAGAAFRLKRSVGAVSGVLLLMALAACTSAGSAGAVRPHDAESASGARDTTVDPSYDWHGLLVVPFGVRLNQSPVALHEVLLFQDAAHPPAAADTGDCYALEGAPPRFMGREPERYLVCFEHDRMSRIEASIRLGPDDAAPTLTRGCALWLHDPAAGEGPRDICEGRDGDVAFSARLAAVADETQFTLNMTLASVASREAGNDSTPLH